MRAIKRRVRFAFLAGSIYIVNSDDFCVSRIAGAKVHECMVRGIDFANTRKLANGGDLYIIFRKCRILRFAEII